MGFADFSEEAMKRFDRKLKAANKPLKDLTNTELARRRRKLEEQWVAETDETKARAVRQQIDRILTERESRVTWR